MDTIKLMEVCGTHTMAIARYGIKGLLPANVELISGPGCPVCVTSQRDIDAALEIAGMEGVITATFGDMIRVPGSRTSLADLRREGADVRIVYSCLDALDMARKNADKKTVFIGVGFETTSPTVAATVIEAKKEKIGNFFVLPFFKLIFPALSLIAGARRLKIDGFICPGHVSVITGTRPYEEIARRFGKPCVITGFEEDDIIRGVNLLIRQINEGARKVEVEYGRAVSRDGNPAARRVLSAVFDVCDSEWRGLGKIKKSGLKFKASFSRFDALERFGVKAKKAEPAKGCICGKVIQGISSPGDCRLFRKRCTPQRPVGPCMVSSEGTCAAYFKYGY